jgi:hypothetical protein
MAQNNLRVVYQNLTEHPSYVVTASSSATTSTGIANIGTDIKSLVWRSSTSSIALQGKANLVATFPSNVVRCVILAFTNLSSVATIRVRGYTGTAPVLTGTVDAPTSTLAGTQVFDSGTVLANPYQSLGINNWNNDTFYPITSTSTDYTARKMYSRVWIPTGVACTSVLIEIIDTNNINKYVEVSRLILGDYWSPQYNTSYGLSTSVKDLSTSNRSEAGDLITTAGAMYNTISFDLKFLSVTDKITLNKIFKLMGTQKSMFISLFPDNTTDWEKEQLYQIYGRLASIYAIDHPIFEMYSSQVEIEEI